MDPVGAAASIITPALLAKDVVATCSKCVKNYRGASVLLSRFCDELQALTILFDHLLIFQQTAQIVPSCRYGALSEILSRTDLLSDYERQLKAVKAKLDRIDMKSTRGKMLFPLLEHQISDDLDVVRNIRSNFESALLIDDSFFARFTHIELQKISATMQANQGQSLIDKAWQESKHQETIAMVRNEFSRLRPVLASSVAQDSRGLASERLCLQPRTGSYGNSRKRVYDLWLGRVSVCNQNAMRRSRSYQIGPEAKRSRVSITFVPSLAFWQTIIRFQVEWAAHLDSLSVPIFGLQFLDIVPDDHSVIRASTRGDFRALEGAFSSQKISPFCSTKAGWTPLHYAAGYGQLETCKFLLTHGAPLDATGVRGITPLHLAAHFGRFDIFKLLLSAGSDPDDYHENGLNAFFEILSNEAVAGSPDLADFVKWLLSGQDRFIPDTRARDNSKRGFLYHLVYPPGWSDHSTQALTAEQHETVESMVRGGIKCDQLDIYDTSIFHQACRDGRLDLVKILLSGDVDINAADGSGHTPLHHAVESRNFELVATLIQHGSNFNSVTRCTYSRFRLTPLGLAAKSDWVDVVALMLQHGKGCCDEDVAESFYIAVYTGSISTVIYLIDNNLDQVDFRDSIYYATSNLTVIGILCQVGAPLDDVESTYGWTPLTIAARNGWHDAVEKLAALGADIDKIANRRTPLGWAAYCGHVQIVHTLLAAGAAINLTGSQMPTPLQSAKSCGFEEIEDMIASCTTESFTCEVVNRLPLITEDDKANVGETSSSLGWDLTAAIVHGQLPRVERLISQGCSLAAGKYSLQSPLRMAINRRKWKIARRIVEVGAELNRCPRNKQGYSVMPFMDAVTDDNVAFIELMIRHGADVDIRNDDRSTPLIQSLDLVRSHVRDGRKVCCHNGDVVRALLSAGADATVSDKFGRTALGKAAAVGNLEAVIALVGAGVNLNKLSSQNCNEYLPPTTKWVFRTPMAWAALNGHKDVVKFLFGSGAEWRSLPKEPALTYTHGLLMQSWFPQDAEVTADASPDVDLLNVPPGADDEDQNVQVCDNSGIERTPAVRNDHENNHPILREPFSTAVCICRWLARWIGDISGKLQSVRIEIGAFAFISLLLLIRESLRHVSIPRLREVKLAILAMLIGVLVAKWMN